MLLSTDIPSTLQRANFQFSTPPPALHDNEEQDKSVVIPGSAKEAGAGRREDGVRNCV